MACAFQYEWWIQLDEQQCLSVVYRVNQVSSASNCYTSWEVRLIFVFWNKERALIYFGCFASGRMER